MNEKENLGNEFISDITQGVRSPVFFDPHKAIYDNRTPGTLIVGSPGSGKSF